MTESQFVYSGRSHCGLGRSFERPAALWRNYRKIACDPSRDGTMVSAYEVTIVNGGGLYLMIVHRQPVTDSVNFEQACKVVDDWEATS